MGIEQIEPFIFTLVVGGVVAAMDAAVAATQQGRVRVFRNVGLDEEIDVASGPDDLVRCERQSADQGWRGLAAAEGDDGLLDLFDEARHYMLRRYSPPTS